MSSWFSLPWLSSNSNPPVSQTPSFQPAVLLRRPLVPKTAPLERRSELTAQESSGALNSRLTASCTELNDTDDKTQQFVQSSPLALGKQSPKPCKESSIRPKTASPVRRGEPAGQEPSASLSGRLTKSCMELNDTDENLQQFVQAIPLLPTWPSPKPRIETSPRGARTEVSVTPVSLHKEESKAENSLSSSQGISIPKKVSQNSEIPECSFVSKIGPPPGTKRRESATDRNIRMCNYSEFTSFFEPGPTQSQLRNSKTSSVKTEQPALTPSSLCATGSQSIAQTTSVGSDCMSQSQPIPAASRGVVFQKFRLSPDGGATSSAASSTMNPEADKGSFTLQSALKELGLISKGVSANTESSGEDSRYPNPKPVLHPTLTTTPPSDSWKLNSSSADKKTLDQKSLDTLREEEAQFLAGLGKPSMIRNQQSSPNETCPDSCEENRMIESDFEGVVLGEEWVEGDSVEEGTEISESDKENQSFTFNKLSSPNETCVIEGGSVEEGTEISESDWGSSSPSCEFEWNLEKPLFPDIGAFLKVTDSLKTSKKKGGL